MSGRAEVPSLGAAFVDLARLATRQADAVEMLMTLSERAVDLLPVEACGVLVTDAAGLVHTVGASGASTEVLRVLRAMGDGGPASACIAEAAPVAVDAEEASRRWPALAVLLDAAGHSVVHAFPMLSREVGVGAIGLVGSDPLDAGERDVAQALADLGALALLRSDAVEDALVLARRLERTVQARATVAQAVGVLAERHALRPDGALALLRRTAGANGATLVDVAGAIVDGDLRAVVPSDLAAEAD